MTQENCTVLIINDSSMERTTYRGYLQQETSFAYTVWEAESTAVALRLCSSQPPDSIVLDYLLPDCDGLEFLTNLKTSIGENCPPVIMLNEEGNEAIAIQAFKAGVEDYLIKDEITSESLRYVTRTAIENFRLRQELRQSEERFRTSIENMFDCFGIYTAIRAETGAIVDFKFEYLNAAALQSNRMTVDDVGKSLCEVLPAHRESGLFTEYCRVVETGEPLVKDCLIYSDQFGDQYLTRAYNVQIRKLDDGLVASWRDITEQKQSEVALQQSEERYRAVVEDQTELICRFLPDCTLTFVNGAYSRYFDSTPTELIGQNFLDLIPESDRFVIQQQITELSTATPENAVITVEHPVVKPNGKIGWQQWTDRAIFDDDGQLVEFQAVGRDITERKKTELALQKANECFEIAAALNCLIYDYDLKQNIIERSQGLTKLFGYSLSESEPTADWWYERIHPSQREAIQAAKRAALLGTEVSVYLEYQVRHQDQHYVWVADRVCIMRDESGQAVRIIGSTTDITERKLAEQQLRESQARLQLGVRVAGIALARFDYASNTVELSPEAAVLYGFSANESIVTRDRLHATFHPEEKEMLEGIIQQMLDPAGDGWFELEHRVVWPHGEVRWLYVRKQVFFERSGNAPRPQSAILAAIDITERKQAEALVQHQLAQIEAIYTTAPVGLCFLDRQRRFIQINERLAEINGLSASEHIGRTVGEILPQLAEIQEPIFEQVLQTGMPVLDVEVQGTTPAQPEVERYWLANYYPLKAADGESLGINITVQEITDRKQAEREREQLLAETQSARAAAEEANRSKDEFVAVVAHELRSPINSVAGWAQLLRMRKFDQATIDRALEAIERGTQTQVQLIEDLLDISRIACGTLRLTFAPLNLTTVIQAAISLVRPMADAKQIELETQFTAIAQIYGDLNRLQQIAVNLLTNAIKFTPEQGGVTIIIELVEQQVRIQVRDSGKGINPEFLPQIFEQFQQGQRNSGSKDGLGLGLAIVKNLVELHNGTITAESPGLGQGATFTVWLPLHESQPVVTPTEIPPITDETPLAGIRILAIDDEPDSLELLRFILENAGAEVQTATNCAVALDLISQFDFELLVSDITMPDISGHELIQQIQTLYPERRIRAIALTAYASSSDRDYSLRIGFEQYFSKPIEPAVLVAAIVSLIQEHG